MLTVDPIGMSSVTLSDPQTLNLYAYCANDPINSIDPSGLGFLSFFKKLFKGIGKVFKAIWKGVKAIGTVLGNKWVQLAIGIALAVITLNPAMLGLSFAESGARWTAREILMTVLSSALTFGRVAQQLQDPQDDDVIRVETNICANGNPYPFCSIIYPAPTDETPWIGLTWEFFSGRGRRHRQFGPDTSMTSGLRTSPDVARHRQQFCNQGGGFYSNANAAPGKWRFGPLGGTGVDGIIGSGARDGHLRAFAANNGPRLFVGSFDIAIRGYGNSSALFVITNQTTLRSFLYHRTPESWNPSSGLLSTTTQTYWWTENNPCGR